MATTRQNESYMVWLYTCIVVDHTGPATWTFYVRFFCSELLNKMSFSSAKHRWPLMTECPLLFKISWSLVHVRRLPLVSIPGRWWRGWSAAGCLATVCLVTLSICAAERRQRGWREKSMCRRRHTGRRSHNDVMMPKTLQIFTDFRLNFYRNHKSITSRYSDLSKCKPNTIKMGETPHNHHLDGPNHCLNDLIVLKCKKYIY